MTKFSVEFGETREDAHIVGTGRVRHCVQLSPSFAICAIDLERDVDFGDVFEIDPHMEEQSKTKILDVLMTRQDGWNREVIEELMRELQQDNRRLSVTGFPEMRKEKSVADSCIFCVHAVNFTFDDTCQEFNRDSSKSENSKVVPDPKTTSRKSKNSDRGANDASRFAKLAFFLLSEFGGYEGLSTRPVLDVAGGSGGLAFELSVRHQLPCIIVDTRMMQYSGTQQRHLEFRRYSYQQLTSIDDSEATPLVKTLLNRFRPGVSHGLLKQIRVLLETDSVLSPDPLTVSKDDNPTPQLRKLIHEKHCSVLVGLHPDQATDPIIEIGLALNIPWVVVPCCVFPNLFKERRLAASGNPVRTYDDLCEYILQRDPGVKEVLLPFRGRNRAFYWKPAV